MLLVRFNHIQYLTSLSSVIISVTDGETDILLIDRITFLFGFTSYVRVLRWAPVFTCVFLFR